MPDKITIYDFKELNLKYQDRSVNEYEDKFIDALVLGINKRFQELADMLQYTDGVFVKKHDEYGHPTDEKTFVIYTVPPAHIKNQEELPKYESGPEFYEWLKEKKDLIANSYVPFKEEYVKDIEDEINIKNNEFGYFIYRFFNGIVRKCYSKVFDEIAFDKDKLIRVASGKESSIIVYHNTDFGKFAYNGTFIMSSPDFNKLIDDLYKPLPKEKNIIKMRYDECCLDDGKYYGKWCGYALSYDDDWLDKHYQFTDYPDGIRGMSWVLFEVKNHILKIIED